MATNQRIKHHVDMHLSKYISRDIKNIIVSYVATDIDETIDYIRYWSCINPRITYNVHVTDSHDGLEVYALWDRTSFIYLVMLTDFCIGFKRFSVRPIDSIVNYMTIEDINKKLSTWCIYDHHAQNISNFIYALMQDINRWSAQFLT